MNILLDKPIWYISICVTISVCYAYILYYFKPKKNETNSVIIHILFSHRLIYSFLLSMILLNPVISYIINKNSKPNLFLAVDNSASMKLSDDSVTVEKEIYNVTEKIRSEFSSKYNIKNISFGDSINTNSSPLYLDQNNTDIGKLLTHIRKSSVSSSDISILISDGINNSGINPLHIANNTTIATYSLGTGKFNHNSDIEVSKIYYEKRVNTGSLVPIRVLVNATNLNSENCSFKVYNDKKLRYKTDIKINSDNFSKIINYDFRSDTSGVFNLKFVIDTLSKDSNLNNNSKSVVFTVKDTRKQILIINKSPHPDIRAIKLAMSKLNDYNITFSSSSIIRNSEKYNLIVIFNPEQNDLNNLKLYSNNMMYMLSSNTSKEVCSTLYKENLTATANKRKYPHFNSDFEIFNIDQTYKVFEKAPPISGTATVKPLKNNTNVLLFNKTNSSPIIHFNSNKKVKSCFINGEGFWRWRNFEILSTGKSYAFDSLINKIISFLTADSKRKRFVLNHPTIINSEQSITFNALLYNKSFEPTSGNLTIKITKPNLNSENIRFVKAENGTYNLKTILSQSGKYSYTATAKTGDEVFTIKGSFIKKSESLELSRNKPDHFLLSQISKLTGASFHKLSDYELLIKEIQNSKKQKNKTTISKKVELANDIYVLIIIMLLLISEWFIRRLYLNY